MTDVQLSVHDIQFDIAVTDAARAVLAEQAGATRQVRIPRHVEGVVKAWLGK
ncbi:MAG: hypothetical protein WD969_12695 [Paracoccaceae bacterium]